MSTNVVLGVGDDRLDVVNWNADDTFSLSAGAGIDQLNFDGLHVGGTFEARLGGGRDTVTVANNVTFASQASMRGNAGADVFDFEGDQSEFDSLGVELRSISLQLPVIDD